MRLIPHRPPDRTPPPAPCAPPPPSALSPYPFDQVTTCSQNPRKLRDGEHLPESVQALQRAVVRVHDFAHLLVIALRSRVAAKRDDAPAIAARGRGVLVLHERRPVARHEKARIPGDAKAVVALRERPLFLARDSVRHQRRNELVTAAVKV